VRRDWHAINDTMLAHGQLLVDDPERIGPIQVTGMLDGRDAVQPGVPHPAVGDHVRLPLKPEGPQKFTTTPIRPRTGTEPLTMRLFTTVLTVGAVYAVGGLAVAAAPASAEPMPTKAFSSCKQLRAEYPAGIAKTAKARNKVVRKGFRTPIVCPRVYKQVAPRLDPNRNKVACESR